MLIEVRIVSGDYASLYGIVVISDIFPIHPYIITSFLYDNVRKDRNTVTSACLNKYFSKHLVEWKTQMEH